MVLARFDSGRGTNNFDKQKITSNFTNNLIFIIMKTIQTESIKQSITENFNAYPESYPISGGGPSDDAVSALVNWVENEYDNSNEKGDIDDWYKAAIDAYLYHFEDYFDVENEEGENREFVEDQVKYLRNK